jgi:hypothetical protein
VKLPSTVDDVAWMVLGVSNRQIISDANWQAMGFAKCPRRGAFFDWFVSSGRIARERFLTREFFVWPFATQIFVICDTQGAETAACVGARVLELLRDRDYARALRFANDDEMFRYIVAGGSDYLSDIERSIAVFIRRAQVELTKCEPRWAGGFALLTADSAPISKWQRELRHILEGASIRHADVIPRRELLQMMRQSVHC